MTELFTEEPCFDNRTRSENSVALSPRLGSTLSILCLGHHHRVTWWGPDTPTFHGSTTSHPKTKGGDGLNPLEGFWRAYRAPSPLPRDPSPLSSWPKTRPPSDPVSNQTRQATHPGAPPPRRSVHLVRCGCGLERVMSPELNSMTTSRSNPDCRGPVRTTGFTGPRHSGVDRDRGRFRFNIRTSTKERHGRLPIQLVSFDVFNEALCNGTRKFWIFDTPIVWKLTFYSYWLLPFMTSKF